MPKPKIISEGDPNHVHVMIMGTSNTGKCKCGREVSYDYAEYSEMDHNTVSRGKADILPYDILSSPRYLNY